MKICSICSQALPLDQFDCQSTGKLGVRADCKDCRKRFTRTERGLAKSLYGNQIAKSKKRKDPAPSYTEQDLYDWMVAQPNFQSLFTAWKHSNYVTQLKPSGDRLDDYKPYSLSNLRLVTWQENNTRQYQDRVSGKNTKACQTVHQHDLSGRFIKKHHSYKEAARQVNGLAANIRNVAIQRPITKTEKNGTIRSWVPAHAYGFVWKLP